MRSLVLSIYRIRSLLSILVLTGCVDQIPYNLTGSIDLVIVDGLINNLPEAQIISLSRSKSDPLTGRPGFLPITGASVQVIVDSSQVVEAQEIKAGTYRLPSDFRGQVGHAYQLRFTLQDGTKYLSSQQIMPSVPPIKAVSGRFNPASLPASMFGGFTAGHDLYLDTQDPAGEVNYYRWDWRLWEKQDWCRSCVQGAYSIHKVAARYNEFGNVYFETLDALLEDCFPAPPPRNGVPLNYWVYDYECRTPCWAILAGTSLNLFADSYTDGGLIANRKVAEVPFYQHGPCLVEIRQAGLTASAYRFYKDLQDQTQNNGGVADPPPTASVGNVQNTADRREIVVGFFSASAVATMRHWLDRKDARGVPPGLFMALNGREPEPEPAFPNIPFLQILDKHTNSSRPYKAVCAENEQQTALKPAGWLD
ncbi:hypothetical protein GCM10027275_01600 [Rhabdobacter roseus]|nr:DUF4249 domain-containing protein [Rhabdobacter roseus]